MLAVDWSQITGGSILVAAATLGGLVAAVVYAVRSIKQDNAETARQAIESWQATAEGRKAELEEARRVLSDQATTIADLNARIHALELVVKDRETAIARLEERPATDEIFRLIDDRAQANLAAIQAMAATQTRVLEALEQNQVTLGAIAGHLEILSTTMQEDHNDR